MIIHAFYVSCARPIIFKSLGKLSQMLDLFHMCIIGNDELATYFEKLRWVNFQKSMRHEGSNERASDNVRRGGCAFRLTKNEFLTIFLKKRP